MARGYRPVWRDQVFLLPPDMREWLPPDHPVWMVISIVDQCDTSAFHAGRRTGGVGRAGYDPDMLVTLLIWAWLQGMRSSRRIERACSDAVSYRVICAGDVPDHVTIARFRADNHAACGPLFAQVLMLAAQLGLGRLETVALDGVKIASNASLSANRTAAGLARAAEVEAAGIAQAAVAAHAATDVEEDALHGPGNPEMVPVALVDPAVLSARINEAKTRIDSDLTDNPDDPDEPPDHRPPSPKQDHEPSSMFFKAAEPELIPRDRLARIAAAQAQIAAQIEAQRAARDALVQRYVERLNAGEKFAGQVPAEVKVALAERQLGQAIAASQAKHARWAVLDAGPATARRSPGRRPVPVEENARVVAAQARLGALRAEQTDPLSATTEADTDRRSANITDPQSRMQPVRGGGWVQGYNCQAVTAADGLILATDVGISTVDSNYYLGMVEKAIAAAAMITHHRPTNTAEEPIGIVLADAGYCTRENLTAPGPNRLIATGKSRDLHTAASTHPAQGAPPEDAGPIAAMNHQLRTPHGIATYAQRSHIAETPFGHAKHNLGFRRFTSRGLARARSEWHFHATVHNIGKIIGHLTATALPA